MPVSTVLLPSGIAVSVRVHPVVVFSICDAFLRRREGQERVIGTLLGAVDAQAGVVEVKNCYVVPHTENQETVAVDLLHHKTMFELNQRVTQSEVIVGWFATGPTLLSSDSLIQEFYSKDAKELTHAVHLLVDTSLQDKKFTVQAYVSRQLVLGGSRVLGTEFVEVPTEVLHGDVERVGAELMVSGSAPSKPLSEAETLSHSLQRLVGLVDKVQQHVDQVKSGAAAGDPSLGRYLADTLSVVPHFAKVDFERLFNDSVQDAMMVTFLSNLIRAHIGLAERLATSALPIM